MEGLGAYILSVTAAAVLCTLALQLTGGKGTIPAMMRLLCGIVMASVIVRPLGEFLTPDLSSYFGELDKQVSAAVAAGTERSRQELAQRITEQTCTYIQDKAAELGAVLSVQVTLDSSAVPVPVGVILEGQLSPSAKVKLEQVIEKEIGIGKEDLVWK